MLTVNYEDFTTFDLFDNSNLIRRYSDHFDNTYVIYFHKTFIVQYLNDWVMRWKRVLVVMFTFGVFKIWTIMDLNHFITRNEFDHHYIHFFTRNTVLIATGYVWVSLHFDYLVIE